MGSLYGYEIDCELPLARLSDVQGELGRITVRADIGHPLAARAELVRLVTDAEWRPQYVTGRLDRRVLSWHSDAGTFVGDPASMEILYRTADSTVENGVGRWEDRLASTAIPLLLGEIGGIPLHAAANRADGRGVVICGVTGRGKSTLSAALAAAGCGSMGEDGVVLFPADGGHTIWPGLTGSLLTDAAAECIGTEPAETPLDNRGRRLHHAATSTQGAADAGVIAFLRDRGGSEVEVEPVSSAKTHRELIDHLLLARQIGPSDFAATARVAESVSGVLLRLPDSLDAVDEAAERLVEIARAGSP